VVLSSFLFAIYQLNVFQFVPHFILGLALGSLVIKTGSVLPALVFHLVYNGLLIGPTLLPWLPQPTLVWSLVAGTLLAGLWLVVRTRSNPTAEVTGL
jgi:membrane protease YdiL (CAAX protease family)